MKEKILKILEEGKKYGYSNNAVAGELLNLFSVSERYLHINDAAALIKSMPTDQAVQKIKAALSGQPETTVINGELLIKYHNAR